MQEFDNRVAVVTGGGGGIGRALCEVLAGEGMHVVVADIDLAAAEETVRLLPEARKALAVRVDVSDLTSVEALAEAAFEAFGAVHLLCNNAGVLVNRPLTDTSVDDWQWTFSVNVMGVVNGVQAFLPRMLAQRSEAEGGEAEGGEAHIVNTASIQGLAPGDSRGVGCYGASKAAVAAYSEVLRAELAEHGIGVSVLLPGRVPDTGISRAERNRPERFGGPLVLPPRERRPSQLKTMQPIEVARKVVAGIRANRQYIAADPERVDSVATRFEQIVADFEASAAEDRSS